jgi:hypothetical protein
LPQAENDAAASLATPEILWVDLSRTGFSLSCLVLQ